MLKLIKKAIYNQFLIDHSGKPFAGDERAEDSAITPMIMLIGLCDKFDVDHEEIKEMLCLEEESYLHKLGRYNEMVSQGQSLHLLNQLKIDTSIKRFYMKYLLCMNYITIHQDSYLQNEKLLKPYKR